MTILFNGTTLSNNCLQNLENVQCVPTVYINNPEKNCYYAITLTDPDCSYPSYLHWFIADIPYTNPNSLDSSTFVAFLGSDVRNHRYIFTLYKYYEDDKKFMLPLSLIGNSNFNEDIFAYINNIKIVCTLTYNVL